MPSIHRFIVLATAILAPALCAADAEKGTTPDIENGRATFMAMCGVCHAVQLTGGPVEGPNLVGVVGREAGSQPEFTKYSEALKASGLTWDRQTLDKFLTNPMEMVPNTLMPMLIADAETRADVVAYLATLQPAE